MGRSPALNNTRAALGVPVRRLPVRHGRTRQSEPAQCSLAVWRSCSLPPPQALQRRAALQRCVLLRSLPPAAGTRGPGEEVLDPGHCAELHCQIPRYLCQLTPQQPCHELRPGAKCWRTRRRSGGRPCAHCSLKRISRPGHLRRGERARLSTSQRESEARRAGTTGKAIVARPSGHLGCVVKGNRRTRQRSDTASAAHGQHEPAVGEPARSAERRSCRREDEQDIAGDQAQAGPASICRGPGRAREQAPKRESSSTRRAEAGAEDAAGTPEGGIVCAEAVRVEHGPGASPCNRGPVGPVAHSGSARLGAEP